MSGKILGTATISESGKYRYELFRLWEEQTVLQIFVMLYPSTADASEDDPTIRRCISFAKREKMGGIWVVNLFGMRATDPKLLALDNDPVGNPDNEYSQRAALRYARLQGSRVIVAWGANTIASDQARKLCKIANHMEVDLVCLGTSNSGAPRHPLYIKGDEPLVEYHYPESK